MIKKTILGLAVVGGLALGGCSSEMMGSSSQSFQPFGKPVKKTQDLSSQTTTPDESVQLKGIGQ